MHILHKGYNDEKCLPGLEVVGTSEKGDGGCY